MVVGLVILTHWTRIGPYVAAAYALACLTGTRHSVVHESPSPHPAAVPQL